MKRTPMRRKRATPRRRTAPRGDADWWENATRLLLVRCGHRCERCGQPLTRENMERHHRQRRRDGGDRLSNLLALHSRCHAYITEHPAEARANGWIVPVGEDPTEVTVVLPGLTGTARWYLRDDGTKQVAA